MDLFQFDTNFIAAVSGGLNDDDTAELFAEAIRAGADVLEQRLISMAGDDVIDQVRFVDGAFEIALDEEQFATEFGGAGASPQANVRRAIIASAIPASIAMTRALNGD